MVLRWSKFVILIATTMQGAWLPQPIISYRFKSDTFFWSSLSSQAGFTLISPTKERIKLKDTHLFLKAKGRIAYLNGRKLLAGKYILLPTHQPTIIDTQKYTGPLSLHVTKYALSIWTHPHQSEIQPLDHGIEPQPEIAKQRYMVRVLLDECIMHNKKSAWSLISDHGFMVWDVLKKTIKHVAQEELSVNFKRNNVCLNKLRFDSGMVYIIPKQGFASVDGVPYHGSFLITKERDHVLLINNVDLEEYVYCVLRTESWPGWPLEVNKAFAIASRSYVMAQMKKARKKKLPYHVKNTNEHQTYKGMHNCLTSRAAIDHTRGLFLAYNNEPVLAMFDSCCGGVVPAHVEDFDFNKAPYLKRSYPCKHCKRCRLYAWNAEFEHSLFHKQLQSFCDDIGAIKEVKIAHKDKAGLVKKVAVRSSNGMQTLSGQQFYKLFKEVKSFHFTMKKKSNKLVMNGRGYGHHLGLCQWGAREMVRDGWSYRQILQFYYPGTQFLKLPS